MTVYTTTALASILSIVVNLEAVLTYIHEEDHDDFLEAFPNLQENVTISEIANVRQVWALRALSATD